MTTNKDQRKEPDVVVLHAYPTYVYVWLLIWLAILWLKDAKGVTIFGAIGHWIATREVVFSPDCYQAFAIVLSIPYVITQVMARVNDRWRITHNEWEHRSLGIRENAISRGAKQVMCRYVDIFQFVLGFGAGTLLVYSANGQAILATIENVQGLFWRFNKISRILESTAVTPLSEEATQEAGVIHAEAQQREEARIDDETSI